MRKVLFAALLVAIPGKKCMQLYESEEKRFGRTYIKPHDHLRKQSYESWLMEPWCSNLETALESGVEKWRLKHVVYLSNQLAGACAIQLCPRVRGPAFQFEQLLETLATWQPVN